MKIRVQYSGGESRMNPGKAIDYMLAVVDGIELYAEVDAQDDNRSYDELRQEIIAQAETKGIKVSRLRFDDPASWDQAYAAGEYGHMVRYDNGYWQMETEADEEDWHEVLTLADEVESMGPLMGWGEYTSAWKVTVNGGELYYFVR